MTVWVFNLWLYIMFVFNPPTYNAMVQSGAPCWYQTQTANLPTMGLGFTGPQPACWYDASNVNSGSRFF